MKRNSDIALPKEIKAYWHCNQCLKSKPDHISARDHQMIEVGMTADGSIQVWCKRHDINIALVSCEGR